jgi:hypothetical protein
MDQRLKGFCNSGWVKVHMSANTLLNAIPAPAAFEAAFNNCLTVWRNLTD